MAALDKLLDDLMDGFGTMSDFKRQWTDPVLYFATLIALTVPFLMVSTQLPLLAPGLPAAALAVVCPAIAALLVSRLRHGSQAVHNLLGRTRMPANSSQLGWSLVAVCLPILATVISVWWQGASPALASAGLIAPARFALLGAFVAGAWLEELGWSAFATEALLPICGLIGTGLVIGLVWALWHYVPLLQVGRSLDWIAWWTVGTMCTRLTLVLLYLQAERNVWAPTIFHACGNACWQTQESLSVPFDPRSHALAASVIAVLILAFSCQRRIAESRRR